MYGGRELRQAIRPLSIGYVLVVRAKATITPVPAWPLTAASAVKVIPYRG